jgi:biopolymer transport protein ExbD
MASISAGAAQSGRKALNPSIALVPFLDLLLCCVMFLLVTAVWNDLGGLSSTQAGPGPSAEWHDQAPRIRLFLAVRAAGYELGSSAGERRWIERGDPKLLREALLAQRALDTARPQPLTLTADDGVSYQELVSAMDCAVGVGFAAIEVSDHVPL